MKQLKSKFSGDASYLSTYFPNSNIAFIDIETDGLSHKNKIVIIGLVLFSSMTPSGEVIQLFNDDYQSERDILIALFKILREHDIDAFVSFNGDSFDFPFINARLKSLKLTTYLDKRFNYDLMRIVKRNKDFFNLDSYTLKNIEMALGIHRTDTISGKDSIILYNSYLETKDPKLEQIILLHNFDDIVNMVPLLNIYKTIPSPSLLLKGLMDNQKLYLISSKLKKKSAQIILGHPYSHFIIESQFETISSKILQSLHEICFEFDVQTLKYKNSDEEIVILDTQSIYGIDFISLPDSEKQRYLFAVNGSLHEKMLWQILTDLWLQKSS